MLWWGCGCMLWWGLLACLDNDNKDDFDGDFLHAHPLEGILEETLGGNCLVHHGYMQKVGWCDTYDQLCYHRKYKNQIIYHLSLEWWEEEGMVQYLDPLLPTQYTLSTI